MKSKMFKIYRKLQVGMALGGSKRGPSAQHVGIKLASSGHRNPCSHHLSDEGRYKEGWCHFGGGRRGSGGPWGGGIKGEGFNISITSVRLCIYMHRLWWITCSCDARGTVEMSSMLLSQFRAQLLSQLLSHSVLLSESALREESHSTRWTAIEYNKRNCRSLRGGTLSNRRTYRILRGGSLSDNRNIRILRGGTLSN